MPSLIATILDPSCQDIEFDRSCLEGLDAQLVHFPTNAFAAMCWLGATGTIPTHLTSDPATRNTKVTHEEISSGSSSDESESESDESHTPDDHVATVFVPKESDAAFGIRPMVSSCARLRRFINNLYQLDDKGLNYPATIRRESGFPGTPFHKIRS